MEKIIRGVTENYRDRIQRLALFDPLYKLENKKTKDKSNNNIDFFSLGLLTLLFFFENMLIRNKKTGVKELTDFLYTINKGKIDLDYKGFQKISKDIIETFRPSSGKRNHRTFFNWETRKEEMVQYSILKASKSDTRANVQYYTLDEQGLELIFATKEYFSEFQLSMNQLLLRKQLEKGEFIGAIRQIDEMRINVETLEDRITKIKHEIQQNIISEKTYERYKDLLEDIHRRLKYESEEFNELKSFVKETKERMGYELKNDKDKRAYEYIIKVDKELGEVHFQHGKLLKRTIELKTTTLRAAEESLYYVGIDSFNFKNEIVSRLFSSPLPLEASKTLIKPLLYLEKQETWSPMMVFFPQRIENNNKEDKTYEFLNIKDEEEMKKEVEIVGKNFKYIMEIILKILDKDNTVSIKEVVKYMKENDYNNILNDKLFYHFLIILHQKSPIVLNMEDNESEILFKDIIELLQEKYKALTVVKDKENIKVNDRFNIQNIIIKLEEDEIVL
ncbi:replicative DNA helicase [Dethiothermospora halolimnae]|uniref:replicative DNA helicase n=1 Tax=Dethiothermospora halolimnae TaxID=3114390 RepID=UPI003CCC050E